ncbi:MAG: aminotransferase class V-fold PLP-dependent enzyme [Pirellulaceae bacterium]|nr:aminotransferase class V-fold PLP-dependent enzyme [Pirellulaceae bacterium]
MTPPSDPSPRQTCPNAQESDWDAFRREMPVAERWAYLDHAAVAPLPEPAGAAMRAWIGDATENGDANWPDWSRKMDSLRAAAAAMLGAAPGEIALVKNTTEGINLVAEGFPWSPGDNVVTLADEFPSNQYPWMNLASRGVETRRVPVEACRVDLGRIADAMDARTRVVAVSWVGFSTGWRNDVDELARLAHDGGALLFLDAIQGLGVFELDVTRTPVDFLAADGHKWMLGPEGAGVFYIRREHLDLLRPLGVGWGSVKHHHEFSRIEFDLKDDASRYEGGSINMPGMIALGESLGLLCTHGQAALARRVIELTDLACRRLERIGATIATARDDGHKSGIVIFEMPGRDPAELARRCKERGVILSCRGGRLRISPHAYNNEQDIDRLVTALGS